MITSVDLCNDAQIKLLEAALKIAVGYASSVRINGYHKAVMAALAEELETGDRSLTVSELLSKLLSSEKGKELVFEAQRRVYLSSSRELGPWINGYLTFRILIEERQATEDEEIIFNAAQQLTDSELSWFSTEFKKGISDEARLKYQIHLRFEDEFVIYREESRRQWPLAAMKLSSLGIVNIKDNASVVPGDTVVICRKGWKAFVDLIDRATGATLERP